MCFYVLASKPEFEKCLDSKQFARANAFTQVNSCEASEAQRLYEADFVVVRTALRRGSGWVCPSRSGDNSTDLRLRIEIGRKMVIDGDGFQRSGRGFFCLEPFRQGTRSVEAQVKRKRRVEKGCVGKEAGWARARKKTGSTGAYRVGKV